MTHRCALWALAAALAGGCTTAPTPLRGGTASAPASTQPLALTQPDNPAAPAIQTRHWSNLIEWVPLPTVPHPRPPPGAYPAPDAPADASPPDLPPPAPARLRQVTVEETRQVLGAAQQDTSRALAVRAASLRPAQYFGVILLAAALAMFHPLVAGVVGSRTTQAACGAAGLVLIFSPALVPGRETLLIVMSLGLVLAWWMAHRHGELRAAARANREKG